MSVFSLFFQMPPGIPLSNSSACLSFIVHLERHANHNLVIIC